MNPNHTNEVSAARANLYLRLSRKARENPAKYGSSSILHVEEGLDGLNETWLTPGSPERYEGDLQTERRMTRHLRWLVLEAKRRDSRFNRYDHDGMRFYFLRHVRGRRTFVEWARQQVPAGADAQTEIQRIIDETFGMGVAVYDEKTIADPTADARFEDAYEPATLLSRVTQSLIAGRAVPETIRPVLTPFLQDLWERGLDGDLVQSDLATKYGLSKAMVCRFVQVIADHLAAIIIADESLHRLAENAGVWDRVTKRAVA